LFADDDDDDVPWHADPRVYDATDRLLFGLKISKTECKKAAEVWEKDRRLDNYLQSKV
jgi:hypothetical protein